MDLSKLFGIVLLQIAMAACERYCYVCSGHRCLQNPMDPDLFPGRTKCHAVEDYCVTHVRYLGSNDSIKAYSENGSPLAPRHYSPQSVTRSCAKIYLGNLCRRDYNGDPHVTCISTCQADFCNCDSRSPPPEMFPGGKVLPESPKKSTYSANDLNSCRAMAGVPGYEKESEIAIRRTKNLPEDELRGLRRFVRRRNSATGLRAPGGAAVGAVAVSTLAILRMWQ